MVVEAVGSPAGEGAPLKAVLVEALEAAREKTPVAKQAVACECCVW